MEIRPISENSAILAHQGVKVNAGVSLSGDLNLTTQEGDKVQISFGSDRAVSGSRSQTRTADGSVVERFSLTAIAASRYSVTVQGDLNEDELASIRRLVDLVDPLAADFFAGRDIDLAGSATTLADNLGVIQELSLELEKTTFASVQGTRFSRAPQGGPAGNPSLQHGLPDPSNVRDFPALVESVLDAVFSKLAAGKMDEANIVHQFGDFLEFLKDRLQFPKEDGGDTVETSTPEPAPTESAPSASSNPVESPDSDD